MVYKSENYCMISNAIMANSPTLRICQMPIHPHFFSDPYVCEVKKKIFHSFTHAISFHND